MALLAIIGTLIGAVLGLRFKMFILVPVTSFALAIVAGGGFARGDGFLWIAAAMVLVATFVQLGYLGMSAFGAWRATSHGGVSMDHAPAGGGAVSRPAEGGEPIGANPGADELTRVSLDTTLSSGIEE